MFFPLPFSPLTPLLPAITTLLSISPSLICLFLNVNFIGELFFKDFYLFLERREGRRRGRETSMCERYINWLPLICPQLGTWPATQAACALTGNRTGNLLVHRLALSPLGHTNQGIQVSFNHTHIHTQKQGEQFHPH